MLSYRHGFHAGNHADVIKHLSYQFVLDYFNQKAKPFTVIDTHAGAGAYQLDSGFAAKNKEYLTGIGKLWHASTEQMPVAVQNYVQAIRRFNVEHDSTELLVYPGSPWFALDALPLEGKAFFHELHPADAALLQEFVRPNRYRKVIQDDGFVASVGLFPPPSKRGVVMIDPPYELKEDYQRVVEYLKTMYKRFNNACYMLWYPVVDRTIIDKLEKQLIGSGLRNIQLFELQVSEDTEQHGMTGSGMIVVNPPWTLGSTMQDVLPYLVNALAPNHGSYRIVQLVDE